MNALKTVGIALFVAAVTAASVVWYIDYKVNEMTEAVVAPIRHTTERVDETIEEIGDSMETATEVLGSTIDGTRSRIAGSVEQTRDDVRYEIENAQELAGRLGDWLSTVSR